MWGCEICTISLWQNKGGHHESEITGEKLETSRSKYQDTITVSEIDDTTMHGILK